MRIKIIEKHSFKKSATKKLSLKIFLFLLFFDYFFILLQMPVFCAQEKVTSQEVTDLEAEWTDAPSQERLFPQERNKEIAVSKAFVEAYKQIVLDKESQSNQVGAQKIIEQKKSTVNKKQAVLDNKAQLNKERKELARMQGRKGSEPPEDASDYITIKVRPLNEILEQAEQLLKDGKYEDALASYSYAHDITKDKAEKKNILKKKSDIQDFIANRERQRITAEKKILQEVEQSTVSARKVQL